MNELMTSSYDTPLTPSEAEWKALEKVDKVVDQAITSGSPQVAIQFGVSLRNFQHVAGLALAKLLYEMRERWDSFGSDDDWSTICQYEMGIGGQAYKKYIACWEFVILHKYLQKKGNEELQERIMSKPIKALLLLNAAAREGEIAPKDWERIGKAATVEEIRDIRNEIRWEGKEDQKPGKKVWKFLVEQNGKMKGRYGNGHYKDFGVINRRDPELAETVEAFIARMESVGVIVEPAK